MKFKVDSWVDKPVGYTGKWYKFFVSDVNLDIIESELFSICIYIHVGWPTGRASDLQLQTLNLAGKFRGSMRTKAH